VAPSDRTAGSEAPDNTTPIALRGSVPQARGTQGSTTRRVAFRVVSIVTSVWVLALMFIGLTEVVLMWLPGDTLSSVGDALGFGELDLAHRAHFMSIGVIHWAIVLGVLVQLRRPERREAPMLHVVAIAISLSVTSALGGSLRVWLLDMAVLVIPLLLLGILHPRARQLVRLPTWDRVMVALATLGVVPWLVFAFTNAQLQGRNIAGDTHAEMDHWSTMAFLALVIIACSFIGATDRSGWRLTAWIAALASINYGLHSLVYPEPASAASAPWAIAALTWGIVYATSIFRRSRRTPDVT
jgi:hypothetical protein